MSGGGQGGLTGMLRRRGDAWATGQDSRGGAERSPCFSLASIFHSFPFSLFPFPPPPPLSSPFLPLLFIMRSGASHYFLSGLLFISSVLSIHLHWRKSQLNRNSTSTKKNPVSITKIIDLFTLQIHPRASPSIPEHPSNAEASERERERENGLETDSFIIGV